MGSSGYDREKLLFCPSFKIGVRLRRLWVAILLFFGIGKEKEGRVKKTTEGEHTVVEVSELIQNNYPRLRKTGKCLFITESEATPVYEKRSQTITTVSVHLEDSAEEPLVNSPANSLPTRKEDLNSSQTNTVYSEGMEGEQDSDTDEVDGCPLIQGQKPDIAGWATSLQIPHNHKTLCSSRNDDKCMSISDRDEDINTIGKQTQAEQDSYTVEIAQRLPNPLVQYSSIHRTTGHSQTNFQTNTLFGEKNMKRQQDSDFAEVYGCPVTCQENKDSVPKRLNDWPILSLGQSPYTNCISFTETQVNPIIAKNEIHGQQDSGTDEMDEYLPIPKQDQDTTQCERPDNSSFFGQNTYTCETSSHDERDALHRVSPSKYLHYAKESPRGSTQQSFHELDCVKQSVLPCPVHFNIGDEHRQLFGHAECSSDQSRRISDDRYSHVMKDLSALGRRESEELIQSKNHTKPDVDHSLIQEGEAFIKEDQAINDDETVPLSACLGKEVCQNENGLYCNEKRHTGCIDTKAINNSPVSIEANIERNKGDSSSETLGSNHGFPCKSQDGPNGCSDSLSYSANQYDKPNWNQGDICKREDCGMKQIKSTEKEEHMCPTSQLHQTLSESQLSQELSPSLKNITENFTDHNIPGGESVNVKKGRSFSEPEVIGDRLEAIIKQKCSVSQANESLPEVYPPTTSAEIGHTIVSERDSKMCNTDSSKCQRSHSTGHLTKMGYEGPSIYSASEEKHFSLDGSVEFIFGDEYMEFENSKHLSRVESMTPIDLSDISLEKPPSRRGSFSSIGGAIPLSSSPIPSNDSNLKVIFTNEEIDGTSESGSCTDDYNAIRDELIEDAYPNDHSYMTFIAKAHKENESYELDPCGIEISQDPTGEKPGESDSVTYGNYDLGPFCHDLFDNDINYCDEPELIIGSALFSEKEDFLEKSSMKQVKSCNQSVIEHFSTSASKKESNQNPFVEKAVVFKEGNNPTLKGNNKSEQAEEQSVDYILPDKENDCEDPEVPSDDASLSDTDSLSSSEDENPHARSSCKQRPPNDDSKTKSVSTSLNRREAILKKFAEGTKASLAKYCSMGIFLFPEEGEKTNSKSKRNKNEQLDRSHEMHEKSKENINSSVVFQVTSEQDSDLSVYTNNAPLSLAPSIHEHEDKSNILYQEDGPSFILPTGNDNSYTEETFVTDGMDEYFSAHNLCDINDIKKDDNTSKDESPNVECLTGWYEDAGSDTESTDNESNNSGYFENTSDKVVMMKAPDQKRVQMIEEAAGTFCNTLAAHTPQYGNMKTRRSRFSSFGGKVWTLAEPSIEEIVYAGLFYKGPGDCTECFSCGIIIIQWCSTDIPIEEHLKHSPGCSYIKDIAGLNKQFLSPVIEGTIDIIRNFNLYDNCSIEKAIERLDLKGAYVFGASQLLDEIYLIEDEKNNTEECEFFSIYEVQGAACQELLWEEEMLDLPSESYSDIEDNSLGEGFISFLEPNSHLPDALDQTSGDTEYNNDKREDIPHEKENSKTNTDIPECRETLAGGDSNGIALEEPLLNENNDNVCIRHDSGCLSTGSRPGGMLLRENRGSQSPNYEQLEQDGEQSESDTDYFSEEDIEEDEDEVDYTPVTNQTVRTEEEQAKIEARLVSLRERNEELRLWSACKVCLTKTVTELFIECGHLACCSSCSERLDLCPICRKQITTSMTVYMQ